MMRNLCKASIGFLLFAFSTLLFALPLEAKVTGYCSNCHTMHNSQNGQPMARGDALDSASTSFFICLGDQPSLDGKYTIFGKVIKGEDVVDNIAAVPLAEQQKPKERVELIHAEVVEQP